MLRLILPVTLFLISLLTIFPAPAYPLWLLTIIVDEFPWAPILVIIICFLFNIQNAQYPLVTNVFLLGALLLYISPMIKAKIIATDLAERLSANFGQADRLTQTNNHPFGLVKIFNSVRNINHTKLTYKHDKQTPLSMDFYPSALGGNRPCVIVVHGGSWKSGDNTQLPELNSILSREGYHVAAINYRLAPGSQSPAPVRDVKDAIAFLKNNSEKWHIDPNRFVLLGRSAGAQIALLAAYTLHEPSIKGVIDFYGPADMVWGYSIPSNPLIMDSRKVMEDYLGGSYAAVPTNYENSSPILFTSEKSPPTLLIHGENDPLVAYEHSRRLNLKLQQKGVPHYLLSLPWATHGFDYNINGPGGQLSTYAVSYFLNSVTR
ncbi:MAG: alpha/beta hydrolase [Dyadobacter sp.]|uniref:alpha/beta hydrolase n=1 Tax=Dyadobacter sp. TaxID=1914288 RepID=UPI0032654684